MWVATSSADNEAHAASSVVSAKIARSFAYGALTFLFTSVSFHQGHRIEIEEINDFMVLNDG